MLQEGGRVIEKSVLGSDGIVFLIFKYRIGGRTGNS